MSYHWFGEELFELLHPVPAVNDEDGDGESIPDVVAFFSEIEHGNHANRRPSVRLAWRDIADKSHDGMRSDNSIKSGQLLGSGDDVRVGSLEVGLNCIPPSIHQFSKLANHPLFGYVRRRLLAASDRFEQ